MVCYLRKSIYGLKQAPRVWYKHLTQSLSKIGFEPVQHSECAYIKRKNRSKIVILIYVDDMLLIGSDNLLLEETSKELITMFKIRDMEKLSKFLGVNMTHTSQFILMSQSRYTKKILTYHSMMDCRPVNTPMDPAQYDQITKKKTANDEENFEMQSIPYREAIGQLLYLSTRTRPGIVSAINVLSRHVANPRPVHWTCVKRLLRYLRGTMDYSLRLEPASNILEAHADSDRTGSSDRISVTGNIIQL